MKKWVLNYFYAFETEALTDYLEKQAAKGWLLEKVGLYGLLFRRGEPSQRRYYADLPPWEPTASDWREQKEAYVQMCGEAGWEYVGSDGWIYVFSTEEENVPPLHTDPQVRYRAIDRIWRWRIRLGFILLLLTVGSNVGTFLSGLGQTLSLVEKIERGYLLLLELIVETEWIWSYHRWSKRQKQGLLTGDWHESVRTGLPKLRIGMILASWIYILWRLGSESWPLVQGVLRIHSLQDFVRLWTSAPVVYLVVFGGLYGIEYLFWWRGKNRIRGGMAAVGITLGVLILYVGIGVEGLERIRAEESGLTDKLAVMEEAPFTCVDLGLTAAGVSHYSVDDEIPSEITGSYSAILEGGGYLRYTCGFWETEESAIRSWEEQEEYPQWLMDINTDENISYEWLDRELEIPGAEAASLYVEHDAKGEMSRYVYNIRIETVQMRLDYAAGEPLTLEQLERAVEQVRDRMEELEKGEEPLLESATARCLV